MVEAALVYTVLGFFLFGVTVLAVGIYRYQEIALLAREGARWASVHGGQYQSETGHSMATAADVYNNAILPMAIGLDTSQLSYSVTWANNNEMPTCTSGGKTVINTVTVAVSYTWVPEVYFDTITMSSTEVMAMSY